MPSFARKALMTALLFACAAPALAEQPYPSKPVRMVVNFPAGGPLDTVARIVAERAGRELKQPIVVDNRGGAAGNIGAESVARAAPDGYTVLMTIDTVMTVNPYAYRHMAFNPNRDLEPAGLAGTFNLVLVTNPGLKTTTFADFLARAKKEDLSYASAGVAAPGHLVYELLKARAQIKGTHIAYKGNAPALADVVAGQVPVGFLATPTALPFIKSGRLVPLAASGTARDPLLPQVPTVAELGVKDFNAEFAFVLMLPAKTPAAVRAVWEQQLKTALADPDVKTKLTALAIRPESGNGAEAAKWLAAAGSRWSDLIRKLHVQLD
jgi:tripartite-type tricarboxylate transporter receptor subunit TctC